MFGALVYGLIGYAYLHSTSNSLSLYSIRGKVAIYVAYKNHKKINISELVDVSQIDLETD